jgi:hypothetical protein
VADLSRRDQAVLSALQRCPEHWGAPADDGFLPLHIAAVAGGYWTFQGLMVALEHLQAAGAVQRTIDGRRWLAVAQAAAEGRAA